MCKIAAIIQARSGSTRLGNKVFADICGKPLIYHIVKRLQSSQNLSDIIIATTENALDDEIYSWAINNRIKCFRGNEQNVLDRFYSTATIFGVENIVRITADDPFKDPAMLDEMVEIFLETGVDLLTNNYPPSFPEGMDIEIFSFKALSIANNNASANFQKEHVTQYFYQNENNFTIKNFEQSFDTSFLRWTIDTQTDLEMVREVYKYLFKENEVFGLNDIYKLLEIKPYIALMNQAEKRSFMYKK